VNLSPPEVTRSKEGWELFLDTQLLRPHSTGCFGAAAHQYSFLSPHSESLVYFLRSRRPDIRTDSILVSRSYPTRMPPWASMRPVKSISVWCAFPLRSASGKPTVGHRTWTGLGGDLERLLSGRSSARYTPAGRFVRSSRPAAATSSGTAGQQARGAAIAHEGPSGGC
jgi:hypothetical protein